MASTVASVGDIIMNGLEAYEILEQLRAGEKSDLYRVTCRSGRLRNRQLALKKVLLHPSSLLPVKPHPLPSTSLHQALHHPNIISLLSAFSTTRETFHVLELCAIGSLTEFLHTRPQKSFHESELRGVAKSLVDALLYLRKEFVIHGDINPTNILLTGDYRIKLANFKHSTRLASKELSSSPFARDGTIYTAPELRNGEKYGFPVDVWSLGCVMVYCLSGLAPTTDISQKGYKLPDHLSSDAKALLNGFLQLIPENRIYLNDMSSHPFFAKGLPVTPLQPSNSEPGAKHFGSITRQLKDFKQPNESLQVKHKTMRHISDHNLQVDRNGKRLVLGDIGNLNLRDVLCGEMAPNRRPLTPTRRIVSDPVRGVNTPFIVETHENSAHTPIQTRTVRGNRSAPALRLRHLGASREPMNTFPTAENRTSDTTQVLLEFNNSIPLVKKGENKNSDTLPAIDTDEQIIISTRLPIGTVRPKPLNTVTMNSLTHKTTYGQVTILPSQSLLVDFRESHRRKGLRGNEVLIIEPNGMEISVYSAPHLSSPCCLVEPLHRFSIQSLPSVYWKQYNDAARLVDQIKQRTPKLVVYSSAAKYTLMSNIPRGDVELLFSVSATSPNKNQPLMKPSLRIRFSRQNHSLELARHVLGDKGEEWIKKVIIPTHEPPYMSVKDWKALRKEEKDAMHHLTSIVQICDTVEILLDITTFPFIHGEIPLTDEKHETNVTIDHHHSVHKPQNHPVPTVPINSFSSFKPIPRPLKFSLAAPVPQKPDVIGSVDELVKEDTPAVYSNGKPTLPGTNSAWSDDLVVTAGGRDIQTRFIPSVGWCIRYASEVSQGGRYRIMFLDGVALDIDVDEDWVEFKSQSGEATVYNIQECGSNRGLGERMKVFEEFVSLFDNSQAG